MDSILVAVTTFNRLDYVRAAATSLSMSKLGDRCSVWVFDDFSDEYDESTLRSLYPFARRLMRSSRRLGSGGNMRRAFEAFLASESEALLLADSDLLFHPGWPDVVSRCFPRSSGVLSLYNSVAHPAAERLEIEGEPILRKEHIGAAGAVLSRPVVADILAQVPISDQAYDWRWSRFLFGRGTPILTTERSYVQHIGALGTNSDGVSVDVGLGFIPGNEFNQNAMIEFYDRLFATRNESMERFLAQRIEQFQRGDLQYRLGGILMLFYRLARHLARAARRLIGRQRKQ